MLASGAHRVDTGKVAALIGAQRVRRASPEFVLAATGQEVGGVAPVGHPAPLRTVVDIDLAAFPVLWAGGGDHHTMFCGDLRRPAPRDRRRGRPRRLKALGPSPAAECRVDAARTACRRVSPATTPHSADRREPLSRKVDKPPSRNLG